MVTPLCDVVHTGVGVGVGAGVLAVVPPPVELPAEVLFEEPEEAELDGAAE